VLLVTAVCSKFRVAGFKGCLGATCMTAHLIVPGFNGGNPMKLLNFDSSPVMRAAGGGRAGRLADWSGRFDLESEALAQDLNDHLEHPLEEGESAVSEIIEEVPPAAFRFEGVAVRYRGATRFSFDAFSRKPA
jgi:hypothetical protein